MASPSIAIVTHGLETGGGVPAVARWLAHGFASKGAEVEVHDLATSRRDEVSLRLADPRTWLHGPGARPTEGTASGTHWGAWATELEFMRYAPRQRLLTRLNRVDTVQVVCGTPAWAVAVRGVESPVALQVATTARWERQARWPGMPRARAGLSKVMSQATHRLDRLGCRSVDHVMVENAAMHAQVQAWGQSHVSLCPPGVDTETFHPRAEGWNRSGDIVSLGRLAEERKRFDRVLESYALAHQMMADLPPLRLVGRGQLPELQRRRIDRLGLTGRVTVESDLSPLEVRDRLRDASVFLQASSEEGLGIAVLEAMASGLPVVTTETAGTRETVLDRVTGRLVAQTESVVEDLAAALVDVWSGDGEAQGRRGRDRVLSSFSSAVTMDRFWAIHESLRSARTVDHLRLRR